MEEKILELKKIFEGELSKVKVAKDLEQLRVQFLGKKGPISALMQDLKSVDTSDRPLFGKRINDLKILMQDQIESSNQKLYSKELKDRLKEEEIDVFLPGKVSSLGRAHPISQMLQKKIDILIGMGFSVYYSPEIESDYYNYGGLHYPEDHPARDMQDTYYLDKETLLRSHTTAFQQRVMESHKPPIRMICPGKCYRNETISSRSHVIFHQVDVLYIDKGVTMADLLATQEEFYSKLFDEKVEIRVRGSYFPFVEPGMEIDVRCTICKGKGCRLCKDTGWLEVNGAGMVHPEVLKAGGLDPEEYSGFAWGGGVERLCLLMHGINDIRLFMENDMRFLEQFP